MDGTPLLAIRGLAKSYGGLRAVKGIDLDVLAGEVLALVGDNGAGKSTFIKMISGVVAPDAGTIAVDGRRVRIETPNDARAQGIETLHQHLGLVEVFNVQENIFLGRELGLKRFGFLPGLDHAGMRRRTEDLLQRLDIRLPSLERPVRSMSGGQRQAVAISRLLLEQSVRLLIMDEPMAALGVDEGAKVLRLIGALRDQGLAILVISHNLEHVFNIADRIAVMKTGALVDVVRTAETRHDDIVTMIVSGRPIAAKMEA